jgi:pimeloyl-ACP methyl ester carboxylesterase
MRAEVEPALLLLPGLLCDADVWEPVIGALGGVACRVPDYRDAASIGAMAERVLRDAPARFALCGHSMGGRVALEVARRAPERVARLALLDTGYQPRVDGAAGEAEERGRLRLVELARERGLRAMGEEWLVGMVHPERLDDRALMGRLLAMIERQSFENYQGQIRALLDRPDATAVLSRIGCPTLVACGREDAWSPPRRHEQMAAMIPGCRLEIFERCGHMSTLEQPDAVAAALRRWLD